MLSFRKEQELRRRVILYFDPSRSVATSITVQLVRFLVESLPHCRYSCWIPSRKMQSNLWGSQFFPFLCAACSLNAYAWERNQECTWHSFFFFFKASRLLGTCISNANHNLQSSVLEGPWLSMLAWVLLRHDSQIIANCMEVFQAWLHSALDLISPSSQSGISSQRMWHNISVSRKLRNCNICTPGYIVESTWLWKFGKVLAFCLVCLEKYSIYRICIVLSLNFNQDVEMVKP